MVIYGCGVFIFDDVLGGVKIFILKVVDVGVGIL